MANVYTSADQLIGKTPLLELTHIEKALGLKATILAKLEYFNPAGSVKDRIAKAMIDEAEASGKLKPGSVIIEPTSGNTGIGLAAICAAKGYKLVITMPENMSKERILLMRHLGAEVILTPAEDGMKGAIAKADLLVEKNPNVLLLNQFSNQANPDAHRFGTSIEIFEDTGGEVDVLVAAVGTSGTLSGIASTLRSYNPDLYVVAVEPKNSPVLNGGEAGVHHIPGIGAGFVPELYDAGLVDEVIDVEDEKALELTKEVAQIEGLPIGISAGAAVYAALDVAKRDNMKGKNIVVILPDAVERYLSLGFFD